MKSFKEIIEEYHSRAAPRKTNAPMHDLSSVMPSVYHKDGYMKHGHGDETLDKISHGVIKMAMNNPEMDVPVYKAVMRGEQSRIKKGDWVTPNLPYAKSHGESIGKKHEVLTKNVKAKELFSDGSTMHEFGYHPIDEDKPKSSIPTGSTSFGSHSTKKKKFDIRDLPTGSTSFGLHSLDIDKKQPPQKKIRTFKESVELNHIDHLDDSSNPHVGPSIDHIHDRLHEHYDHNALKPEGRTALRRYTSDSKNLNTSLIKNHDEGDEAPQNVSGINVSHLDDALSSHKLPHPLTVYTGVSYHPNEKVSDRHDRMLHLPSYTSSSPAASVARQFGGTHIDNESGKKVRHMLRIRLPEGHHGFYAGEHSSVSDEKEFLLPRGMTVKIAKHPEVYKAPEYASHDENHVWDADVVSRHDLENQHTEKSDDHFHSLIDSNTPANIKKAFKQYPENITNGHLNDAIDHEDESVKRAALSHPLIMPHHIDKILSSPDREGETKVKAMSHPNASEENLTKGISSSNRQIREVAAAHPNATSDHLNKAINDLHPSVVDAAINNKNITSDHIDKLFDRSKNERYNDYAYLAAGHPKASPETLNKALIASNELDNKSIGKAAVLNDNFNSDNLTHALANHHTYHDTTLFHGPKITPQYIDKLIKSKESNIDDSPEQSALVNMIFNKNSKLSDEQKRALSNHESEVIKGLSSIYFGKGKSAAPKDL